MDRSFYYSGGVRNRGKELWSLTGVGIFPDSLETLLKIPFNTPVKGGFARNFKHGGSEDMRNEALLTQFMSDSWNPVEYEEIENIIPRKNICCPIDFHIIIFPYISPMIQRESKGAPLWSDQGALSSVVGGSVDLMPQLVLLVQPYIFASWRTSFLVIMFRWPMTYKWYSSGLLV